jgi:hypothetical protein
VEARGLSITLILAASGVAAGSLVLASVFSPLDASKQNSQESSLHAAAPVAGATQLPLAVKDVFKYIERGGDAIGGSSYFRMDDEFIDAENHCDFCMALEYTPGPSGRAAVALWNSEPLDLGDAKKLVFAARGEKGGERLVTYAAGSNMGGRSAEEGPSSTSLESSGLGGVGFSASKDLTLTAQWQKYEIDLENADLSKVTHGFAFEILKGNEEKQVAYIDSIYFIENDEPGFVPQQ